MDVKERIVDVVDDIVRRDHGAPSPQITAINGVGYLQWRPIGGSFFEASANIDNLRSILRPDIPKLQVLTSR